jgi:hypothetical protein
LVGAAVTGATVGDFVGEEVGCEKGSLVGSTDDVATSDPIGEVAGSYGSTDACGARVMEASDGPTGGAMVMSATVGSDVATGDPIGDPIGEL